MKKIPTLFVREYDNKGNYKLTKEITPGMEWVFNGEGEATVKYDGSATMYKEGIFYKRYDANIKRGRKVPDNAILCQSEADPITGHQPCWVPIDINNPSDKWYVAAKNNFLSENGEIENWTYEAVGPHFRSNSYKLTADTLIPHGKAVITELERSFDGIKDYLEEHWIEGIVFWKDGEPKCKIRRKDYGLLWH